jgi:hypothetical protein
MSKWSNIAVQERNRQKKGICYVGKKENGDV